MQAFVTTLLQQLEFSMSLRSIASNILQGKAPNIYNTLHWGIYVPTEVSYIFIVLWIGGIYVPTELRKLIIKYLEMGVFMFQQGKL